MQEPPSPCPTRTRAFHVEALYQLPWPVLVATLEQPALTSWLEACRRSQIQDFLGTPEGRQLKQLARRLIQQGTKPRHLDKCLLTHRGQALPFVALPRQLAIPLPQEATRCILSLLSNRHRQHVERVFARSAWRERGPIETVSTCGKPAISGVNGVRLGNLITIAHELGHCIYEEAHPGDCLEWRMHSEVAAVLVERALIRAHLEGTRCAPSIAAYSAYDFDTDALTRAYAQLEASELCGSPVPEELPLPRHFLYARHSYATRPGAQLIFDFAVEAKRHHSLANLDLNSLLDEIQSNGIPACTSNYPA